MFPVIFKRQGQFSFQCGIQFLRSSPLNNFPVSGDAAVYEYPFKAPLVTPNSRCNIGGKPEGKFRRRKRIRLFGDPGFRVSGTFDYGRGRDRQIDRNNAPENRAEISPGVFRPEIDIIWPLFKAAYVKFGILFFSGIREDRDTVFVLSHIPVPRGGLPGIIGSPIIIPIGITHPDSYLGAAGKIKIAKKPFRFRFWVYIHGFDFRRGTVDNKSIFPALSGMRHAVLREKTQ